MLIIQGFATLNDYVTNAKNEVAVFGELSMFSSTYAKDKATYVDSTAPGYELTIFKSVNEISGEYKILTAADANEIIAIIKKSVMYAKSHPRNYDPEDFRNTLLADFFGKISSVELGDLVENGSISLPEWISWISSGSNASIKIWLADSSFQSQYDGYEIKIIPPLENVDDFFQFFNTVVTELNQISMTSLNKKLEETRGMYPETYTRFLNYSFINNLMLTQSIDTTWTILIYGKAGDNTDAIKDALINYVLTHSKHSLEEWEVIMPDLFKRTEFVIIPRWDLISIPNVTNLTALYGNIVNLANSITLANKVCSYYSSSHVANNVFMMPNDYKAINLLVVNGENNASNKKSLVDLYPDYIPVSTGSLEFNRMSEKTKEWALELSNMLIAAESMTRYSNLNYKYRKVIRNNVLYLSITVDNVNYLVVAKTNEVYN